MQAARNAQDGDGSPDAACECFEASRRARDRDKNYNKIPVADAQKVIPNLPLDSYMKTRGIAPVKELNFGQPDFFAEVNKMLTDVPVDAWKTYFRWMLVSSNANALPKAFVDESFNFNGKVLTGVKEQQPRWKRCVSATDGNLGEALGAEFVKTKYTAGGRGEDGQLDLESLCRDEESHREFALDGSRDKAEGTDQTHGIQTQDRIQQKSARPSRD
jgi:putative endopeptidase